jgi:hypothetical protein
MANVSLSRPVWRIPEMSHTAAWERERERERERGGEEMGGHQNSAEVGKRRQGWGGGGGVGERDRERGRATEGGQEGWQREEE